MRKIFIKILLFILILMTGILIVFGFQNGKFGIKSYVLLQKNTNELNEEIEEFQKKNTSEYEAKKIKILEAAKKYKEEKKEYGDLVRSVQSVGNNTNNKFDLYDIDFLWTIIGNYATEEGLVLRFDVNKISTDIAFLNKDYIICDLNFIVLGEYSSIIDFIYSLENDERLNFEIRNFNLNKVNEELQATFIVKSAPINKNNLSKAETIELEKNEENNKKNIEKDIQNNFNMVYNNTVENNTIVE